jgi:uncharacterized protein
MRHRNMFGNMSTIPQSPNRAPAGRCSSVLAVGLLIGATLIGAGAANGQSFDCRKARSADELMICQESGLAKLDQELASLRRQRKAKHHKADRDEAGDNETAFMNARRRCGEHRACIEQSYRNRIQELTRSSPEEEREQTSRGTAPAEKRSERHPGSRDGRNSASEALPEPKDAAAGPAATMTSPPERELPSSDTETTAERPRSGDTDVRVGHTKARTNRHPKRGTTTATTASPTEQRNIQPSGSSPAPGERQRSGDGVSGSEAAASEPPKHHQKRSAQAGAQPAPTGTPTIQWVDPPPSH